MSDDEASSQTDPVAEVASLADKIAGLELTAGEREVLASALGAGADDVAGYSSFGIDLLDQLTSRGVIDMRAPGVGGKSLSRPDVKRTKAELDPDFKRR